jgi:hypothetical protein
VLIAGIIIVAVGISDFVIAGLIARRETAGTGGLGRAAPPRLTLILRRSGAVTIAVGVVLIVIGLAS